MSTGSMKAAPSGKNFCSGSKISANSRKRSLYLSPYGSNASAKESPNCWKRMSEKKTTTRIALSRN
jgi:hypothetical protein